MEGFTEWGEVFYEKATAPGWEWTWGERLMGWGGLGGWGRKAKMKEHGGGA